jgi:GT2 family glycosyltransferase
MKIAAVTVTYNSSGVIEGFLDSMLPQTHADFLLYIVDNTSSDNTLERVSRYSDPRLRVIANQTNVGFAEATNQGIRAALAEGCDAVLFVNNDTEFGPLLIEKLVTGLDEFLCDMTAPKILYYDRQQTIWSAGGGFNSLKGYAGFHFGLDELDVGQFDEPRLVEHAPACCLLVRKQVFERIGLMDPRYFVYLDDTDFCYRASRAGSKIAYLPGATLFHKASALTGGPESKFSVRFRTRNQVYFMLKNLGFWRGLFYLPAFELYQLIKLISRKIDLPGFALRQKAFVEGFRVWIESTRH